MVFPLLLLNESKRSIISEIATILHFLAFLISIGLLLSNSVYHLSTSDSLVLLISKRSPVTGWIPIVIAIIGGILTILHLWLWIFIKDQKRRHSRWKTSAIRDGALLVSVSIIFTFACLGLQGFYRFKFEEYLSVGFFEGMLQSNETSTTKFAVDRLQIENRCCGINGIKDWMNISQMDLHGGYSEYINKKQTWAHCEQFSTINNNNQTVQSCYIPFSCCRPEELYCSPWANIIAEDQSDTSFITQFFHQNGCIPALSSHPFLWIQFGIIGGLLLIEIIAAILTQFISSSTYVIEQVGAEEDTIVPSWIFPFGKYSPKVIIDHTLRCFARDDEFDFATLNETYQKAQELKKQRNAVKPKAKNIDQTIKNSAETVDTNTKQQQPENLSLAQ